MGSKPRVPNPGAPPPAPDSTDLAVAEAQKRTRMMERARMGYRSTLLSGAGGAKGSPTLGYTTLLTSNLGRG